jgi:hypothetical protein
MLFAGFKSVIATMWLVFRRSLGRGYGLPKVFQVDGGCRWTDDRRVGLQRHLQ